MTILPTQPTIPWDRIVPIITNKHHTDVFLSSAIEDPEVYNELCHKLVTASPAETFTLHLNTPGGALDSTFMIVDAIKISQATVVARLTGTVASAGTIITMACDDIYVAPHSSFMIHNYSMGSFGKGHELKSRQEHTDKSLNDAFKEFYSGFLTDREMREVIDGKDMWMTADEVLTKWQRKKAYLSGSGTTSDTIDVPPVTRGRPKRS